MTQVHLTISGKNIQNLIEESVENDLSKKILITVFLISL